MKKSIALIAGLTIATNLFSQQIPQFVQYYENPFIYNPSYTGTKENINTYLIHRSLFQEFAGAPVTNAFTIDGPLSDKKIGLGLSLYNDAADMLNRIGASTSYSYRLKINEESFVNLGLGLGVSETRVDFAKAVVRDVNDPFILRQMQRKTNVDASFGAVYFWKTLEVGVAVPQLLENKVRFESNDVRTIYQVKRHYLASAKYRFDIMKDKGISAYPLVLVRYAPGTPFSYDINAVADWENKGWFGVSYKNDYAIGLNIGVRINNALSAGYAYDIITGPIKSYSGMSHEILLGYKFGSKKEEPVPEAVVPAVDNQKMSDLEAVVAEQKKQIDINKEEIEKLKLDLDNLKSAGAPVDSVASGELANSKTMKKFVTSGLTSDFTGEDGNNVKAGQYIVAGAFSKAENAGKAKARYIKKGYTESKVMKNVKTGINYVYVKMTEDKNMELLLEDLNKIRKEEAPDSWIYRLED